VILINIEWHCNLDYSIDDCLPKYSFSRLDKDNLKTAKGSNFRCVDIIKDTRVGAFIACLSCVQLQITWQVICVQHGAFQQIL